MHTVPALPVPVLLHRFNPCPTLELFLLRPMYVPDRVLLEGVEHCTGGVHGVMGTLHHILRA